MSESKPRELKLGVEFKEWRDTHGASFMKQIKEHAEATYDNKCGWNNKFQEADWLIGKLEESWQALDALEAKAEKLVAALQVSLDFLWSHDQVIGDNNKFKEVEKCFQALATWRGEK